MKHNCSVVPYDENTIDSCSEDENGRFQVGNEIGDYCGGFVNFCPFCGKKAPTPTFTSQDIAKTDEELEKMNIRHNNDDSLYQEYINRMRSYRV